jgi:hypothetical protein
MVCPIQRRRKDQTQRRGADPLPSTLPGGILWTKSSGQQVHRLVAPRDQKYQSNFVEFRNNKIVYRRYAGLFFCACVDANDNELAYLEAIHFFVEVLDSFFGNVCELDLVFNFYKVSEDRVGTARIWRCSPELDTRNRSAPGLKSRGIRVLLM